MNGNRKACPAAIQPTDRTTQQHTRIDRLRKASGFFDLSEHLFACETMSLNYPEHQIIGPTFQEPGVHVALVCATLSCPPIRPEAYAGRRLADQLQAHAQQFTNIKSMCTSIRELMRYCSPPSSVGTGKSEISPTCICPGERLYGT